MEDQQRVMADTYDEEAEATGWFGPEVAFGLVFDSIRPGESILDLGIGTGRAAALFRKAGLKTTGMDGSQEMLDACRARGFTDLARHDLTSPPYPFGTEVFDHVVCVWVLNFIGDLSPVFSEAARILRGGGLFVFVVGDRREDEAAEVVVGAEHTGEGAPVTMYRHSARQIRDWLGGNGFVPVRDLAFSVPMDRRRTLVLPARAYLARQNGGAGRAC